MEENGRTPSCSTKTLHLGDLILKLVNPARHQGYNVNFTSCREESGTSFIKYLTYGSNPCIAKYTLNNIRYNVNNKYVLRKKK